MPDSSSSKACASSVPTRRRINCAVTSRPSPTSPGSTASMISRRIPSAASAATARRSWPTTRRSRAGCGCPSPAASPWRNSARETGDAGLVTGGIKRRTGLQPLHLLRLLDGGFRRREPLPHQLLHLLGRRRIELELDLLGVGEEFLVL